MRVVALKLVDGMPEQITVTMTHDEALFVAEVVQHQPSIEQAAVMRGGDEIGSEIYDILVGHVFNRFYDGGTDEALETRRPHG